MLGCSHIKGGLTDFVSQAHHTDPPANKYELAAVVLYRKGEEARSGHYVCYCTPASTLRQGVLFNDRRVDACPDWRPLAEGFVPYILFYIRKPAPQASRVKSPSATVKSCIS